VISTYAVIVVFLLIEALLLVLGWGCCAETGCGTPGAHGGSPIDALLDVDH